VIDGVQPGLHEGLYTQSNEPLPDEARLLAELGVEFQLHTRIDAARLEADDGILVDEFGRAGGRDDVFAAGDVARFPAAALGGTRRVEHEDHANTHGRVVGANMAGAEREYDHLPFFYSDLFDLGYDAVGDVDSRLATVEHWVERGRKGVVVYVDDDARARGVLLWDVWGKVDDARGLILAGTRVVPESLLFFLD